MSRERDLKRLKKSLYETQDILNDLITETGAELEQKWDETRTDTGKRLEKAGKKFEKNYDRARTSLNNIIKETSEDVGKQYEQSKKEAEKTYSKTRKDAEKTYNETRKDAVKIYGKTRSDVKHNYEDLRSEAMKRFAELKENATQRTESLRLRTADLLQGVAAGILSARNTLEPGKRLALRDEKEKHHLGKMGYAKRFIALAVVIISKKDQLLNLGQQIYHKLQDRNAQEAFKNEAREQLDTMRRLVKAYANGHYKEFPYMSLVKIVAAVLYFVSVVDLIPDFIPVLGLTDDLAVLAWVFTSVKDDLQQFVDWEAANEHRREKMESQRAGVQSTTSTPDRNASPNAAANRGTATGTNATAAAGSTTARVNPGGGTTSSGVGAATGSTGSTGTTSGGSTSTGSTTGGSTTNTSGSSGNDKSSESGSSPKGSSGSASSGGGSGSNKR